ncbi:MAG TPA: 2-octaprenyl-6-methoxyphenyl hydroxylase [Xanthomonadales bacterium]|nr:2-octaprenyl-6-methoxyphenyl hydroxylase [Xanthomonadales bacterium]
MSDPHDTCDIAIIGSGLVGASLACALEGSGQRVVSIEAVAADAGSGGRDPARSGFDERNLALAETSLNALDALGVLAHLRAPLAPIRHIHVSRVGDFGAVRLAAEEHGRTRFGAVVVARELGAALEARLAMLSGLRRLCPARLVEGQAQADGWRLRLACPDGERILFARCLIGADGAASQTRRLLAIPDQRHDYQQTLLVAAVAGERRADGHAWERFDRYGPIALLPRPDGLFGAVMGVAREQAEAVSALSDDAWLDLLQQRFGWRAGRFLRVGRRAAYPMVRVLAERIAGHRAVLMGNAAQTLHPIGAQGFNLGLRDALTYAERLVAAGPDGDPGEASLIGEYVRARHEDRERTVAFSDGLARLTSNETRLAAGLRSLGLLALQHLPGLRAPLAVAAMGYRGRTPRLARSR